MSWVMFALARVASGKEHSLSPHAQPNSGNRSIRATWTTGPGWLTYQDGAATGMVQWQTDVMAKRGLTKPELKTYKDQLLQLRSRLRGEVSTMAENALRDAKGESSTVPLHMADIGSDNFEQEFTLSLMANEEDTLNMIEAALERIEDGSFGICEECETLIPKLRLNALPHTPFCVKCAAKIQR